MALLLSAGRPAPALTRYTNGTGPDRHSAGPSLLRRSAPSPRCWSAGAFARDAGGMPSVGRWRAVMVVAALCAGPACTSQRAVEPPPSGDRTSVAARDWPALGRRIEDYLDRSYSLAVRDRRALVVSVGGVRVVERYYGGSNAAATADVRSVTKSVVGTLVGAALAEGRLRSLDQRLGELLPEHRAAMSDAVAALTLRQVLTMTAGLPPDELGG